MMQTRLFIAYSHKDADLLEELKTHLTPTIRKFNLKIWDDKEIDAGATWEKEIKKNLDSADIFLFLITANSLASDYFHNKELSLAIERHKKGEVIIIPIIMRSCRWKSTEFADLEALPLKGKPVISSHWQYPSEAYDNIADGIEKILLRREEQRKKNLGKYLKEFEEIVKKGRLKKEKEQQKIKEEKRKAADLERKKKLADLEKTKTQKPFNIKAPTTPNLNFKPPNFSSKKTTKTVVDNNNEDILFEKGAIILERSFYAALPIIGFFVVDFFVAKSNSQFFSDSFLPHGAVIGIIIFLIYQLIVVVDEYGYIELESEISETVWGVVLTIISCGLISGLGIFILNMIF